MFKTNSKVIFSVFISLVFIGVSGCGSSGSKRPRGKVCPDEYKPMPQEMEENVGKPISINPKDNALLAGNYEYQGAEYYFSDSNSEVKVHIKEDVNAKGELVPSIVCVAGLAPGVDVSASSDGIKSIQVDSSGKQTTTLRRLGFEFKNHKVEIKNSDENESPDAGSSADKVLEKEGVSHKLFKLEVADRYELRTQHAIKSESHQFLIRYKYVKPEENK